MERDQTRYRWPNGARCAVVFSVDLDAASGIVFGRPHEAATRLDEMDGRRFDPRVGVPRIPWRSGRFGATWASGGRRCWTWRADSWRRARTWTSTSRSPATRRLLHDLPKHADAPAAARAPQGRVRS